MKEMTIYKQTDQVKSFIFTKENMEKAQNHIAKYPEGRQSSAVLPLLDLAQRQSGGWLPREAIEAVAELLKMPIIRVFEVASFYTMFNLNPVGKYHLQICGTTPCWLRGAAELKDRCQKVLGIKENEVTCDGKFSLAEVECLGGCVNAPIVQINDDYYEDISLDQMEKILGNLAEDTPCKPGPQIERHNSAPVGHNSGSKPNSEPKLTKKEVVGIKQTTAHSSKQKEEKAGVTKPRAKKTLIKQRKGDIDAG